jgi:hypothetical protein
VLFKKTKLKQFSDEMVLLSMDDLVLFGAAGILWLFLAALLLLFGIYTIGGLMYTAFLSGSYDVLFIITGIIMIAVSLYIATGFWLHKTDII